MRVSNNGGNLVANVKFSMNVAKSMHLGLLTAMAVSLVGVFGVFSSAAAVSAPCAEITLSSTGTTTYVSISEAVSVAVEGDTIEVGDGVCEETIDINKDGLTIRSVNGPENTTIEGGTVEFSADNVALEGFTIDSTDSDRAIGPKDSDGSTIMNNVISGALRGVQGDWYGRPTNLSIVGNTFTTEYGIAGTEDISGLHIADNTFSGYFEAIGLGEGVSFDRSTINQLFEDNTFEDIDDVASYEVGDYQSGTTLAGGSTRFSAFDTYAALSTTPEQVMFSSVPADNTEQIIYQIEINSLQPAGDYETDIGFLAIPRF